MANGEIVFYGTAAIGLPILQELHKKFRLPLIITQPDSRGGRSRQPITPPVKKFALEKNLPLLQPPTLLDPVVAETIAAIRPAMAIVVAYGKFIPSKLYSLPLFKTINIHFSLLPAYRGAAPVQRAIENGENRSGISIFEINSRLDAGDIWSQQEVAIEDGDTSLSYQHRLGVMAAPLLLDTLEQIFSGKISKHPQDPMRATLAPAVQKNEGRVDWNLPAQRLACKLRAFYPWPGLFFSLATRQVKIMQASAANLQHQDRPGQILGLDSQCLRVACGLGSVLAISSIQPEGKQAMSPWQFSLGNRFPEFLP